MPSLPTLQQFNAPLYQPATMKLRGMGMQEQMKRTDIAQKQVDISGKRQAMEEQMFKINARAKHVEMAKGFLPNVSQDNYDDFVAWNKENEVPDVAFKSAEEVRAMTPEQFEQYKAGLDKMAEKDLKLTGVIKQFYDLKGRLPANEAEIKKFQADIKPDTKADEKKTYETNKAQQIDDTRSYYHEESRQLMDPESGLIRQGPADNPTKYIDEYQKILGRMKKDMKRIKNGKLPSWYEGENVGAKSDDDISKILTDGGYKATPEAIKTFRKNNDL